MQAVTKTPAITTTAATQLSARSVRASSGSAASAAALSGHTKRRRSWAGEALRQAISGPTPVSTSRAVPMGTATWS